MIVEEIRIARYRSLFDVTLHPSHLTVLVGANNSGKTNFVDAVDFLADAYRYGLEIAVGRKGGYENIAHRKKRRTKSPILFSVRALVQPLEVIRYRTRLAAWQTQPLRIEHEFAIEAQGQAIEAAYHVREESIRVFDPEAGPGDAALLHVTRTGDRSPSSGPEPQRRGPLVVSNGRFTKISCSPSPTKTSSGGLARERASSPQSCWLGSALSIPSFLRSPASSGTRAFISLLPLNHDGPGFRRRTLISAGTAPTFLRSSLNSRNPTLRFGNESSK